MRGNQWHNVLLRFRVNFGASFFELTQEFPPLSPFRVCLPIYVASIRSAPFTRGFGFEREIELVLLTNRRMENSAATSNLSEIVFGCECRFFTQLGWDLATRLVRDAHGGW